MDYPRMFVDFVHLFNVEHDYYECHEYGEHLWLDWGRPTELKGLIQAAVSLYHLENGNTKGAHPMWQRARSYLAPARPVYLGIQIDRLIADMDQLFGRVPRIDRISTEQLHALNLPRILIAVVDSELAELLQGWRVEPLETED